MRTPPRKYDTDLRLEVETTPTGLPNLVRNPSGEKGAWFWFTPVVNQVMSTVAGALKFTTNSTSQTTAYWWSDYMPLAPSKYVQSQLEITATSSALAQLSTYYLWYDATKTLIGSSLPAVAYTPVGAPLGVFYGGVAQAPAGTAYVRTRYELTRNNAGTRTDPPANSGDSVTFRKAALAWADTAAALATVRVNLMPMASFENSATGVGSWTSSFSMSVARSTTQAAVGTASLRCTPSGSSGSVNSPLMTCQGGKDYAFQYRVRPDTAMSSWAVLRFYSDTAGTVQVGQLQLPVTPLTGASWATLSGVGTAPGNAIRMDLTINQGTPVAYYLDAVMVEQASTVGAYFDGYSSGSGKAYTWGGTVGNSASTETASSWAYVEPVTWRNILGPTHEIQVDRAMLDAGTMSAVVYDATLDPAVAAEVRPGRQVRLRVTNPSFTTADGWESLFEGKITAAKASYQRRDDQSTAERVRVDLTAADNITDLANQAESRGVANVADLPYLLEGKAVPWLVNGSGNQVATATVVSQNDSASVLDQVALTRDTALAQAFVDRTNVLVVRSNPVAYAFGLSDNPADVAAGWVSYSDVEIDFSTDNLINEVMVTWLRYNTTTQQTEEVIYGPYRDAASIATWGVRQASYTIHGATESPSTIAAYAASVLAANAQPVVRPRQATVPVKSNNDVLRVTQRDLGSKMPVKRTGRLNSDYVVTGLSHTLTPELWETTFRFEPPGSVASPTFTPSPPPEPVVVSAATSGVVTPQAGWTLTGQEFYRQGRSVHAVITLTKATSALSLANPNHADQLMGNVSAPWRPVAAANTISSGAFRAAVLYPSGNLYLTGGIADTAWTNANVAVGDSIVLQLGYLLPEGV